MQAAEHVQSLSVSPYTVVHILRVPCVGNGSGMDWQTVVVTESFRSPPNQSRPDRVDYLHEPPVCTSLVVNQ